MTKNLVQRKWIAVCSLAFVMMLGIADPGSAAEPDASALPEAARAQWEAMRKGIAYDYDVCLEHCGGEAGCMAKCEKAYQGRLNMAFQRIKQGFESPPVGDIQQVGQCPYCGMDRQKFAHSRVWVEYDDGATLGTCSIHCAAVDMAVHIDRVPVRVWVGDYDTRELIDAEEAAWVIGGDKMGVMTHRAKWAFGDEGAARAFMKAHGGEPSDFDGVLKATFEDMYQDLRMIREKRKKMRMMKMKQQKGE